jgi:hypothetical protein
MTAAAAAAPSARRLLRVDAQAAEQVRELLAAGAFGAGILAAR